MEFGWSGTNPAIGNFGQFQNKKLNFINFLLFQGTFEME